MVKVNNCRRIKLYFMTNNRKSYAEIVQNHDESYKELNNILIYIFSIDETDSTIYCI